ncbi:hypothetical protein TNCV_4009771 [Trichonephila clavipes]|nr:hypothetical protein TNCV_4009771 [Trichonephila clavipes]
MNKSVREGDAPPFWKLRSTLCRDSPLVSMERKKGRRTAADSVQSEWPLWHAAKSKAKQSSRAGAAK